MVVALICLFGVGWLVEAWAVPCLLGWVFGVVACWFGPYFGFKCLGACCCCWVCW